jgi:hypothetical protein
MVVGKSASVRPARISTFLCRTRARLPSVGWKAVGIPSYRRPLRNKGSFVRALAREPRRRSARGR